jgi:AraC-like DNA-binding protein
MGVFDNDATLELTQSFRERLPAPPLRELVGCVWIQEVGRESPPYRHRTVPNGSTELVCRLGSLPKIIGPQTGPTEEDVAPGTVVVGLRLRPAAASALLALPASELVDLEVDANELWGARARVLGERLAAASSPQVASELVERELIERASERGPLDLLVAEFAERLLRRESGVRSLARSLDISERQLRRRCQAAVGVSPKALEGMFRFQRFLALMHADGTAHANLAGLAREAGYADQSHLTREAVRLAGRTPGRVLHDADRDCRCAHDHTASYRQFLHPAAP